MVSEASAMASRHYDQDVTAIMAVGNRAAEWSEKHRNEAAGSEQTNEKREAGQFQDQPGNYDNLDPVSDIDAQRAAPEKAVVAIFPGIKQTLPFCGNHHRLGSYLFS